jgi:hypothetical protein
MHRAATDKSIGGFDPVFLAWDFVGKSQAKSKSNFGERCPGAASNKSALASGYVVPLYRAVPLNPIVYF